MEQPDVEAQLRGQSRKWRPCIVASNGGLPTEVYIIEKSRHCLHLFHCRISARSCISLVHGMDGHQEQQVRGKIQG